MAKKLKTITKKPALSIPNAKNTVNKAGEQLQQMVYFPTALYTIKKPEFLSTVLEVADEYVEKVKADKPLHEIYPVYMTENMFNDPRVLDFAKYIGQTAWNILESQGYAMQNMTTNFTELWCQTHYKHSLMEQHVHGYGSQIVGFYFLECPPECSRVVIHDPRPGKVQTNLPETNMGNATYASNSINFAPEPGMLMFANSWLPHSFGRHGSDKPMKFIHFNLTANPIPPNMQKPPVQQATPQSNANVVTTEAVEII